MQCHGETNSDGEEESERGLSSDNERVMMTYICLVHICPLLQQHLHHFSMTILSSTVQSGLAKSLTGSEEGRGGEGRKT